MFIFRGVKKKVGGVMERLPASTDVKYSQRGYLSVPKLGTPYWDTTSHGRSCEVP
jgi:hypothetical protein